MSPGVPGVPERHTDPSLRGQLNTMSVRIGEVDSRVGAVEGHTAQLVRDMAEIKSHTARFAGYEAAIKSLVARGILLLLGGIGGTYGVTRYTTPPPTQTTTQVVKSDTTVKVEACTAMQPGAARDDCAIRILADLMGPRQR